MIELLKSDEIIDKLGGRFKLTTLIQRRMVQLLHGARPMVERGNLTDMELVVKEILEGKIRPKAPAEEPEADDDVTLPSTRRSDRL